MRVLTARPVTPRICEMRSAARKAAKHAMHHQGGDTEQAGTTIQLTIGPAGEQDHGGDRSGPCYERDGEGKRRDVLDMVHGHSRIRRGLQPLTAAVEHHLPRRPQQQQATCDAEGRQRYAQQVQQPGPAQANRHQDAECDERAAHRHLSTLAVAHAVRQTQEQGAQQYRIRDDE